MFLPLCGDIMRKIKEADKCQSCPSKGKGIFCELENNDLDDLSQHKVTNTYKKGQTLFVQGNHPFGLYCINSGNIKVTKTGADGKETIVRVAQGGDVLGHRSLFTNDLPFILSPSAPFLSTYVQPCALCNPVNNSTNSFINPFQW